MMSFSHWLAALAVLSLHPGALAQQHQLSLHPQDASVPVSAFRYQSVFDNYRPAGEPAPSPDKLWRDANNEMGKLGGHAGHLKGNSPFVAPKAAAPAPAGVSVDHSKHH